MRLPRPENKKKTDNIRIIDPTTPDPTAGPIATVATSAKETGNKAPDHPSESPPDPYTRRWWDEVGCQYSGKR